jgi:hypothetical protein
MSVRCIGEPPSWLRLERFHLGELAEPERAVIAQHLAACAACAACAAAIEADEARSLLPIGVGGRNPEPRLRARAWWAGVGALALAAAMILIIGRARRTPALPGDSRQANAKGDGMAFVLVRDDGERLVEERGVFREGDRFKALVTCPPSMSASFDLVVFDASGASFPLEPAGGIACANEVPLRGAFRLSGEANETVCLVWRDDGAVERKALSPGSVVSGRHAMCKELRPTP